MKFGAILERHGKDGRNLRIMQFIDLRDNENIHKITYTLNGIQWDSHIHNILYILHRIGESRRKEDSL